MSALLWVLVTLPLGVGALLLVAGRRADRMAAGIALAVTAAALGLAVAAAFRHPSVSAPFLDGLPVELAVDGLSGVLVVTVTGVTLAVLLFSAAEFGADEARARFFGLMLLFAGSMLATVTAATLPVLLMGWEVMGATSWALIGYWWRDPKRTSAADTAFLTTRTADLGLYMAAGAALASGRDTTLSLDGLALADDPWLSFVTAGIIAAALGKSAQLPFSFWLSKAMQGPSPVSALLHSATMVIAGAYLLLRTGPLLDASGWGDHVVAWAGAATALCLGLVAVAQTDLKQLLAASSCAQIGFMVLAAGVGSTSGGTLLGSRRRAGQQPPVAALLTTIPKIGALAALFRLADGVFADSTLPWPALISVLAAASMTLGNLGAFFQQDVKRLLAYSTISQVGYLLMPVAVAGRQRHGLDAP